MAESNSSSLSSVSLSSAEPNSDSPHSSGAQRPTVLLLDTLRAPKVSELSRQWKVQENPSGVSRESDVRLLAVD